MMINCEKASELISKKIDRELSFMENISLRFHTMMCSTCALFEDEAKILSEAIKNEHLHNECSHTMSKEAKEKVKKMLETKK